MGISREVNVLYEFLRELVPWVLCPVEEMILMVARFVLHFCSLPLLMGISAFLLLAHIQQSFHLIETSVSFSYISLIFKCRIHLVIFSY